MTPRKFLIETRTFNLLIRESYSKAISNLITPNVLNVIRQAFGRHQHGMNAFFFAVCAFRRND